MKISKKKKNCGFLTAKFVPLGEKKEFYSVSSIPYKTLYFNPVAYLHLAQHSFLQVDPSDPQTGSQSRLRHLLHSVCEQASMKAGTNRSLLFLGAAWLHGQTPSQACTTPLWNKNYQIIIDFYMPLYFQTREISTVYREFIYHLQRPKKFLG